MRIGFYGTLVPVHIAHKARAGRCLQAVGQVVAPDRADIIGLHPQPAQQPGPAICRARPLIAAVAKAK